MKTILTEEIVKNKKTTYQTFDGKQYADKEHAMLHEKLVKNFSKVDKFDIEWLEEFLREQDNSKRALNDFKKDINEGKVLLLVTNSDGTNLYYEAVEPPTLPVVKAVIKILHRKSIGMGCNQYVHGIIYKGESLAFDDSPKNGGGFYEHGTGRNIKLVLQ